MNGIKVSVVVPIYNVEKYVAECLNSLERQTLKDIEVIMVNDGSTDSSGMIAAEYERRNEKFCLVSRENGGLSAARNTGLNMASGKYVYFLDADDYLLDESLEILYNKAEKDNLDVLQFVAYTFEDDKRQLIWGRDSDYCYTGQYDGVYKGIRALQLFADNGDIYPSCCLMLTRLDTIKENNLSFYEGIIHEDNLFHWELLSISERVSVLNQPLYCRRYRAGSITTSPPDWRTKAYASSCSLLAAEKFIEQHPEIAGATTMWYMMSWLNLMKQYWFFMDNATRNEPVVKSYYDAVSHIVSQYAGRENKSMRLFWNYRRIYSMCRTVKVIIKSKLKRWK